MKTDNQTKENVSEQDRVDAKVVEYQTFLDGNPIDNREYREKITDWFHDRFRSIKFFYQRLTRGFDDSATWSLDIHLAGLILPRLKRFKELNTHTYPNGLTPELWVEILDKMIFAFEYTLDESRMFGSKFDEAEYERVKEGLSLFGQYFHALWD